MQHTIPCIWAKMQANKKKRDLWPLFFFCRWRFSLAKARCRPLPLFFAHRLCPAG